MSVLRCVSCDGRYGAATAEAVVRLFNAHPCAQSKFSFRSAGYPSRAAMPVGLDPTLQPDGQFLSTQGVSPAPVSASPSAVTPARLVPDTAEGTLT